MNTDASNLFHAIYIRRSRRLFNGKPVAQDILNHLLDFTQQLNSGVKGFRAVLVTKNPDEVFKGIIGSYGKIKNAPAYVAFIGDMSDPNVQEKTGYLGEWFILEATNMGLSTCWVGGFFDPDSAGKHIQLLPNEKVLAVSPVGYTEKNYTLEEKFMSGFAGSHKRKDLARICKGLSKAQWPDWVSHGLETARLAPSAVNRQPWIFTISAQAITVSVDNPYFSFNISKRLDCGIAMFHFEVGALHAGVKGKWEYLEAPNVAVFRVDN